MKIRYKLTMIVSLYLIFSILLVLLFLFPTIEDMMINDQAEEFELHLNQISFYMDSFIEDVENDLDFLITNEEFYVESDDYTSLLNMKEEGYIVSQSQAERDVIEILNDYIESNDKTYNAYIGREDGSITVNKPFIPVDSPIEDRYDYDPRVRPWYIKSMDSGNEFALTEPYIDMQTASYDITGSKALSIGNKNYGVLGIDLSIAEISDFLREINNENLSISGIIFQDSLFYTENDLIMNISRSDDLGLALDTSIHIEDSWYELELNGQKYIGVKKESKYDDITYFKIIPEKVNGGQLSSKTQRYIVNTIIAMIILLVIMLVILQQFIVKPLVKFNDTIIQISVMFDSMTIGVVMTDNGGSVVEKNKIANSLLGLSKGESLETIFDGSIINSDGSDFKKEKWPINRIAKEDLNEVIEEIGIVSSDNKITWLTINSSRIKKKLGGGAVTVIEDITYKKNVEIELLKAKEKAEEAVRAKSDFLANISHEIRTPMNAVVGLGSLLENTDLNTSQKDYLIKMNMASKNLLEIINDILDFSKLEAGKLELKLLEFNLDEMLASISNVVASMCMEKDIELILVKEKEVPSNLYGDPVMLNQVLINLCNNAVKFTERGEVILSIAAMTKTEDRVVLRFSIKDTGIGMTEDQVGKLFEAFSQADTSITRKYGGTGLGLSISKKIVDIMGGKIGATSVYNQGSDFFFELQFDFMEDKKENNKLLPSEINSMRIAVIDDNEVVLDIYKRYLEVVNENLDCFSSAKDFFDSLEENKYDLIIIDYKLKDSNGFDIWSRIMVELEKLPKVMLTVARWKEDIISIAEESGFDYILTKPIRGISIIDALTAIVANEKMNKDIVFDPLKDYLDIEQSISRLSGNGLLYLKIIKDFANLYSSGILEQSSDFKDNEESVRYFHTLKGLAGNLGSKEVQELSAKLESKLRNGDILMDNLEESELIVDLNTRIIDLVKRLNEFTHRYKEPQEKISINYLNNEIYSEKLNKLVKLIDDYDIDSEELLIELKANIIASKDRSFYKKIEKALEGYEYDDAIELVNTLVKEAGDD